MFDIEQVIEMFDEYIDANYPVSILGREFTPSDLVRTDHAFYCRELDKFIADRFETVDRDWYVIKV